MAIIVPLFQGRSLLMIQNYRHGRARTFWSYHVDLLMKTNWHLMRLGENYMKKLAESVK